MNSQHGDLLLHAALVVCTEETKDDLSKLIPTFFHFVENTELVVVCDDIAGDEAQRLSEELNVTDKIDIRRIINETSLEYSNTDKVRLHSDYWNPEVLWWKLEALCILTRECPGQGILLLDSDIVFTSTFTEFDFDDVDLAVSPFYWKLPNIKVASAAHAKPVPITERNGQFNAGMFFTNSYRVAAEWKRLFESGESSFYEEAVIQNLVEKFQADFFSSKQNWGSWRRQTPSKRVQSIHIRESTRALETNSSIKELKELAQRSVEVAREALLSNGKPVRTRVRKRKRK